MYVKMNLVVLSLIFFLVVVVEGGSCSALLNLVQSIGSSESNRIEDGIKNIEIDEDSTPSGQFISSNRNFYTSFNRKSDPVTSAGSFNQFGCSFASPGYDLSDKPNPSSYEGILPPSVWGNEVEPLVLSSVEELEDLIQHVEEVQKQVIDTLPYNSIDNYIGFYADYKRSGLDFLSFYSHYRPPFKPREDCIGLAIEALHRLYGHLTPRWPKIASHTYLVSCRINVTVEWGTLWPLEWEAKWGKEKNHVESQLMGRNIKHVLAVLKIEVQGRSGYILLDAGFPWSSPGVLMFDGQYPQIDQIKKYGKHELNYRLTLMLNNSYVHYEITTQDSKNRTRVLESHLIYVRQPYCSFLDNTEKRALVQPKRDLLRSNRKATLMGGVIIETNTKYGNTSKPAVAVLLFSEDRPQRVKHFVPLTYLSKAGIAQKLPSHKDLRNLTSANYLLNMKPGELLDKLQQVESILDDKAFVQGCKEVDEEVDKELRRREKELLEEEEQERKREKCHHLCRVWKFFGRQ